MKKKVKAHSYARAKKIAQKFNVGVALVENILKEDLELRKEELHTYGTTNYIGIVSVQATYGTNPTDIMVRGRTSENLKSTLLEKRLEALDRAEQITEQNVNADLLKDLQS